MKRTAKAGYRPEIQGLRALAAMLVVVYHVWFGRVSGGVDVFFLLSGFLVTGQLLRSAERGGLKLRRVWARMATRLFPAGLFVLAVLLVVSPFVLQPNQWGQTIREIVASALYLENWQLVAASADYFAAHNEASVVQHFWSLAIQGQFYLVWPLLVLAVGLAARRFGWPLRTVLFSTITAILVASLAFSVYLTDADQQLAYFHSLTRAWEFALGGLLVFGLAEVNLPKYARVLLGWAGVLGLVSCGMLLQVGTVFPGYAALWPTLCAAAVIVAATSGSRVGVDRFLATKPMEYLGNLSYSLYLWHWPVLVLYLVARERVEVGLVGGAGIIALSLVLAALTFHFVEEPARRGRWINLRARNGMAFSALVMVPVLVGAGVWQWRLDDTTTTYEVAAGDPNYPGALARTPGFTYTGSPDVEPVPPLAALAQDWSRGKHTCEDSKYFAELKVCRTAPPGQPKGTIMLVGDSHAQQLYGAVVPMAASHDYDVLRLMRGACPFSTRSEVAGNEKSEGCVAHNRAVISEAIDRKPDVVLTFATRDVREGNTEATPDGFVEAWRELDAAGIPVVAVRDNPRFKTGPAQCAAKHGWEDRRCWVPREDILAERPPYADIANVPDNVTFVDLSDYLCLPDRCGPPIGNVQVYMDFNHVSGTFMKTLAPILDEQMAPVMGWG
ncbi:acyltransferase family protein [Actinokineospora guangxiensis]|uniref:Acyltransferase family protein n=1 Tax=Actinokineospora guangxiensis TaxID=1490288 RepID=A0ABW0EWM6_9PSEU